MSTDPSAAALGPDDAVADALASPQGAEPPGDLADLAAAIERLEALMATGPGLDGSAAVERIADIAFVLHEREVEASLCDALDAAVREISDAGLLKSAGTQRTQEAAELLRDLSRRVNDLMAHKQAEQGAEPAAAAQAPRRAAVAARFDDQDMAADEAIAAELFATDLPEDDEFARVVAGLASSLPVRADDELASDPPPEAAAVSAQPFDAPQSADPAERSSDDTTSPARSDGLLVSVAAVEMTLVAESRDALISGDVSGDFSGEPSAPADVAAGEPAAEQSSGDVTSAEELVREQSASDLPFDSLSSPLDEAAAGESISNKAAEAEPISSEAMNEVSPGEAKPTTPLSSTELAVDSAVAATLSEDPANVSALALPVPDVITPPDVVALAGVDENLSPASRQTSTIAIDESESPAAASAGDGDAEPLSNPEHAHHDDQSAAVVSAAGESDQQSPVEAINSPAVIAENADEIFAPVEPTSAALPAVPKPAESEFVEAKSAEAKSVEAKPVEAKSSRAIMPEVQPAIDPDEDPGDLFEPTASVAPLPVLREAATPVAIAPVPGNVAATVEETPQPASGSGQNAVASVQAATSAPDIPLSAIPPTAKLDAKPPVQPASPRAAPAAPPPAPRPAPADPLAPVRALSEEEMIALFS
jgi:hypothetical protein